MIAAQATRMFALAAVGALLMAAPTRADPSVAEHFEEANRTGADVKGEGQI